MSTLNPISFGPGQKRLYVFDARHLDTIPLTFTVGGRDKPMTRAQWMIVYDGVRIDSIRHAGVEFDGYKCEPVGAYEGGVWRVELKLPAPMLISGVVSHYTLQFKCAEWPVEAIRQCIQLVEFNIE